MIVIIGTGAVAAEITLFFPENIKGYLEYPENIEKYYNKYSFEKPVLGSIDDYKIQPGDVFVLGVANIPFRKFVIGKMKRKGAEFINHIHPSVISGSNFIAGEGNVIYPQCIVSENVEIGDFNLLTCQSILSHDCELKSNNVLATTLLCGHTKVGSNNSFGIRSTSLPRTTIGHGNTIQAGMIVDKDIKDNETVFYRFKEKLYAAVQ